MKIAVLSDIHSNVLALEAVLDELRLENPDRILLLGDTFGYYPWAVETWRLVHGLDSIALLGNHDELVIAAEPPQPTPVYWDIAKQNHRDLADEAPEALAWLRSLSPARELSFEGALVRCCHGTPPDNLEGRYYPDSPQDPPWAPRGGQVLLLGHTHYPLVRRGDGLLANPGSVGQPRDGDLRAAWGLLELPTLEFTVRRTPYDVEGAVARLRERNWPDFAVAALQKNYIGPLRSR